MRRSRGHSFIHSANNNAPIRSHEDLNTHRFSSTSIFDDHSSGEAAGAWSIILGREGNLSNIGPMNVGIDVGRS